MLSIGILSTASIVPRFIAAVQETDCCKIEAIASRHIEPAQKLANQYRIPKAYGSYDELLADSDINTVYVAMISSEHASWSKKALEAGKQVLCEKPMALNPDDVRDIFDLAKEKNLFVMEMQKAVFLPVFSEIKDLIRNGAIGKVTMASFSSSFSTGYNSWFTDLAKGGGPWYSNAGYTVALLQYLFDCKVSDVSGLCTKSILSAENQFETAMTMENGLLASCRNSTLTILPNEAVLYGERGRIEIPNFWKARKANLIIQGNDPVTLNYPCEHELIYEVLHAYACIRNGIKESPIMTADMSISTAGILYKMSRQWQDSGFIG
ncbi:MAG: Gfo/Idh/MocA family oxidoreductase [Lachnospiraceae bacterium]|nr:Gfo/Idh/MocA family oxidoreductase [Lachnospiraceae bacterium]